MNRRRAILLGVVLLALPALAWCVTADGSKQGVWILGYYRERWFILNLLLTALCVPFALLALTRAPRRAYFTWASFGLLSALVLVPLESVAVLGWVDYRAILLGRASRPIPEFEIRR